MSNDDDEGHMGFSLVRIGGDPERISESQAKFAGGRRIEPRIR